MELSVILAITTTERYRRIRIWPEVQVAGIQAFIERPVSTRGIPGPGPVQAAVPLRRQEGVDRKERILKTNTSSTLKFEDGPKSARYSGAWLT